MFAWELIHAVSFGSTNDDVDEQCTDDEWETVAEQCGCEAMKALPIHLNACLVQCQSKTTTTTTIKPWIHHNHSKALKCFKDENAHDAKCVSSLTLNLNFASVVESLLDPLTVTDDAHLDVDIGPWQYGRKETQVSSCDLLSKETHVSSDVSQETHVSSDPALNPEGAAPPVYGRTRRHRLHLSVKFFNPNMSSLRVQTHDELTFVSSSASHLTWTNVATYDASDFGEPTFQVLTRVDIVAETDSSTRIQQRVVLELANTKEHENRYWLQFLERFLETQVREEFLRIVKKLE